MAADGRQALGLAGEELACAELARRGYVILARRYRTRLGEIDIVAREAGAIVFVEVKARSSAAYGEGAEAVGWRKQQRLTTMALVYLSRHGLTEAPCRFDVVSIRQETGGPPVVRVVRGAFEAAGRGW